MDKLSYYMAGRNVMSENDYEAKMMAGNPRIQAALNSSKRDLRRELDGAGLTRNRVSKKEFANKATVRPQGNEMRYTHTDGRMMKRMGKQHYNNLVKQAYEEIMGFEKEAYEEIMGIEKEAGDYSRDNGLGMAQQSAIKRIAGAPNKDAVMSKLSAGRRKFLDQADKLKSQYDKANNAYTDLINRGAKNAPATDILKNKLFSLGNQYESAQNKAMNLHYMGRRIRDYRVKEAYEEIMGFEKEAFAPAPRDFSNLPGSTGPTVPRHKKPKGPWVKSDGTDDNKNDGFIARHLDRAKIY